MTKANGSFDVSISGTTTLVFSLSGYDNKSVNDLNLTQSGLNVILKKTIIPGASQRENLMGTIDLVVRDSKTEKFINDLIQTENIYVRDSTQKIDSDVTIIIKPTEEKYEILNAGKRFLVIKKDGYQTKTIDLVAKLGATGEVLPVVELVPRLTINNDPYQKKKFLELGDTGFDSIVTDNIINDAANDFNPDENSGSNENSIQRAFFGKVLPSINRIIGVVAILYLVIIGVKYIFANGDEEEAKKIKDHIIWIVVGLFVVSAAEFAGFAVYNPTVDVIAGDIIPPVYQKAKQIIRFLEYIGGGIFLLNGILAGFGILSTSANEDTAKNEKNFIVNFVVGAMFILVSEVFVRIASFYDGVDQALNIAIGEMSGIINFILTFMAGACALMLILAAVYYVSNFGSEEQASHAKRIIFGCVIGLVVSFSSYVIANFLIV